MATIIGMSGNLRVCPNCSAGHMKPISEVTSSDSNNSQEDIKFYECDKCGYKSAETRD